MKIIFYIDDAFLLAFRAKVLNLDNRKKHEEIILKESDITIDDENFEFNYKFDKQLLGLILNNNNSFNNLNIKLVALDICGVECHFGNVLLLPDTTGAKNNESNKIINGINNICETSKKIIKENLRKEKLNKLLEQNKCKNDFGVFTIFLIENPDNDLELKIENNGYLLCNSDNFHQIMYNLTITEDNQIPIDLKNIEIILKNLKIKNFHFAVSIVEDIDDIDSGDNSNNSCNQNKLLNKFNTIKHWAFPKNSPKNDHKGIDYEVIDKAETNDRFIYLNYFILWLNHSHHSNNKISGFSLYKYIYYDKINKYFDSMFKYDQKNIFINLLVHLNDKYTKFYKENLPKTFLENFNIINKSS